MIVDFKNKELFLKQGSSCKFYDVKIPKNNIIDQEGETKLPNIADIFDLWPYVMYYNQTITELEKE